MVGLCDRNAIKLGRNLWSKQLTQKKMTIFLDVFEMGLLALPAQKAIDVPNISLGQ